MRVHHLDDYSLGEGRLQRQGKAGRLVTLMRDSTGEIEVMMFGFTLEVNRAAEATAALAQAVLEASALTISPQETPMYARDSTDTDEKG